MKDVWEQNVLQAKTLVGHKRKAQMKIAALAIEACEISHGGNRKKGYEFESPRTIKGFAQEIGISNRTLSNWINVYKRVYKHVPINMINKITYQGLELICQKLPKFADKETVIERVSKYISHNRHEQIIIKYSEFLRSLVNNLFPHKVPNVDEQLLSEVGGWFKIGLDRLEDMGIKPKEIQVKRETIENTRHQKILKEGFVLNEYDKKVVSVLRKGNKTTSEIIKESSLDKNKTMRALRKLKLAGVINKNTYEYKLVKGAL